MLLVRLRGASGSRPAASALPRHSRCRRTRSASGSMSRCSKRAPVAAHLLGQPLGHLAERPHGPPRRGDADRAVAVLHRGVGLGPELRRLAQLERGLVRDAVGPPPAEEGHLLRVDEGAVCRRGVLGQHRVAPRDIIGKSVSDASFTNAGAFAAWALNAMMKSNQLLMIISSKLMTNSSFLDPTKRLKRLLNYNSNPSSKFRIFCKNNNGLY